MESEQKKKKTNDSSFIKWLLTSVIGTTISIILTFGTTHIIEERKKNVEGRQAAMMVIHDMDQYVEFFTSLAEQETASHDLAIYVLDHLDNLKGVPRDTLSEVVYYLAEYYSNMYSIDESTEKTFLSSQDIWKKIKNPLFIDIVQDFFLERHVEFDRLNNSGLVKKPVPLTELIELMANSRDNNYVIDYSGYLYKKLQDKQILYYIDNGMNRVKHYKEVAEEWQHKSDQCKFMMNITDEELETYLTQRKRTGTPLKDRQLIGKWEVKDDISQQYEFKNDHSFVHTIILSNVGNLFSGHLRIYYIYKGQWSITNDTLLREYDPWFDFKIDDSEIIPMNGMRDSLEQELNVLKEKLIKKKEQMQQRDPIKRCAHIDKSGNKIELSWNGPDEDGEVKDQTTYFIRMTNNKEKQSPQ